MYEITKEEWTLLFDTINAYVRTQTLITACDLDLFSLLASEPGLTLNEIAEKISISPYSARVLLLCCCETKLIYKDKDTKRYYNSSAAQKMLNSKEKYSMLGYILFNSKIQKPTLEYFTDSIKSNIAQGLNAFPGDGKTLYERLSSQPELETIFQNGLSAYSHWMSSRLLSVNEFKDSKNILELAGGDGTLAILIYEKFRPTSINILELPTVCEQIQKKIQYHNVEDYIGYTPCDVFEDEWPKGYDTIMVSHFVEIFSPDKIIQFYRKISTYLPSFGTLILWAAVSTDKDEGGLQAAKSSMYFLTTAGGGGLIYTLEEHKLWLELSGLKITNIYHFNDIEHAVIVANKLG